VSLRAFNQISELSKSAHDKCERVEMNLRPKRESETAWIKAYMDLSGVTESQARSVYMYVGCYDAMKSDASAPLGKPTGRLAH
jgi:hypothetical protein